jgi:two-component system NarL family sensor kinase
MINKFYQLKQMISIRSWMLLIFNTLIIIVVTALGLFFYNEFQKAIDERVLLHLTSIKQLKRIQIEEYFNSEIEKFQIDSVPTSSSEFNFNQLDSACVISSIKKVGRGKGLLDITNCALDSATALILYKIDRNGRLILRFIDFDKIQHILLERSGMGESGESYLVAADYRLRSESRFFPDQKPYAVTAKTNGVERGLEKISGSSIITDYRGVPVFSSYQRLEITDIKWVILSEIDVKEANRPLVEYQAKLIGLAILVIVLGCIIAFSLSNILAKPILHVKKELSRMALGHYETSIVGAHPAKEIADVLIALEKNRQSLLQAITFSKEIGNMNLTTHFDLKSEDDLLGKSLIGMQQKLIAYDLLEKGNLKMAKKMLIEGQENERKRLAKELHDGLGPALTVLKLQIQSLDLPKQEEKEFRKKIDDIIKDIRRMSYDLMPQSLMDFGVKKSLFHFLELVQNSTNLEIDFTYYEREDPLKLSSEVNICLFRICQELTNNTIKHANASKIIITITEFENKVALYYLDDGIGFDLETIQKGAGIRNIQERVQTFDGYLIMTSGNKGTEVEAEIPK